MVGTVAHKPLQVHHLGGLQAVLLKKRSLVVFNGIGNTFLGHEHMGFCAYKLERVAVPRNQKRVYALFVRQARVGADDVVRLVALTLAHGDAHFCKQLFNERELRAKVVGRFSPSGLVLVVFLVAEGGSVHVKCYHKVTRLVLQKL